MGGRLHSSAHVWIHDRAQVGHQGVEGLARGQCSVVGLSLLGLGPGPQLALPLVLVAIRLSPRPFGAPIGSVLGPSLLTLTPGGVRLSAPGALVSSHCGERFRGLSAFGARG